jgi:hypothetical protein
VVRRAPAAESSASWPATIACWPLAPTADEYAGHLLELAYSWSGRRAPALVVGMASSRKLEGRMRAVLDPARNRTTPSRRMWLIGAAIGTALLLPLAAMTMTTASADARERH